MSAKIVTITSVKTPWYAFSFLLKKGFKKSIPDYAVMDGLNFKYYHSTDNGKNFGGIYLWENMEKAKKQFSEKWFENIQKKYNCEGNIAFYELLSEKTFVENGFNYAGTEETVTVLIPHLTPETAEKYAFGNGILRSYLVNANDKMSAILLFKDKKSASEFIQNNAIQTHRFFSTPVLLNNDK
jgi:hypothetical protein